MPSAGKDLRSPAGIRMRNSPTRRSSFCKAAKVKRIVLCPEGSRRPSILPVPDMFTSSTLNISTAVQDEADESDDELEDEVPWRSPSEKIA